MAGWLGIKGKELWKGIHTLAPGMRSPAAMITLAGTKADIRKGANIFSPVAGWMIALTSSEDEFLDRVSIGRPRMKHKRGTYCSELPTKLQLLLKGFSAFYCILQSSFEIFEAQHRWWAAFLGRLSSWNALDVQKMWIGRSEVWLQETGCQTL